MKALKLRPETQSETLVSLVHSDERKHEATEDPPIKRWGWVWRSLQDTARCLSVVNSSDLPRETETKEWIR